MRLIVLVPFVASMHPVKVPRLTRPPLIFPIIACRMRNVLLDVVLMVFFSIVCVCVCVCDSSTANDLVRLVLTPREERRSPSFKTTSTTTTAAAAPFFPPCTMLYKSAAYRWTLTQSIRYFTCFTMLHTVIYTSSQRRSSKVHAEARK